MFPSSEELSLAQIIWNYMFLRQNITVADVIIGLGCHDVSVADDVATLYKQNVAPVIVFSGNTGRVTSSSSGASEAQIMRQRALQLGVPDSAILLEEISTNTGENIRMTQNLLQRHTITPSRVALVHKPYMLRRDYATFKKQWVGADNIEVTCWAKDISMNDYLHKDNLDARATIEIMIGDLQRVREYPKHGFQISQHIPADVWNAFEVLVQKGYVTHLLK